jgi:hypothetical protein
LAEIGRRQFVAVTIRAQLNGVKESVIMGANSWFEVTKEHILSEIRKAAKANGGAPLGRERFERETGVKESHWLGRFWPSWGDAVREAGFAVNPWNAAYPEEHLLAVGRRERELAIQLPEKSKTVHVIETDDPEGIEAYWHRRFAARRANGEWFALDTTDVAAFKRRRFM